MYKLCKTEQSAQRQRQLEDGLLELMLTQRYEDISISQLCDQLQVPRKSFYRYFSSKDGALRALIDHRLLDYEFHTGSAVEEKTNTVLNLDWFYEYWLSQRNFLDALDRSDLSGILTERAIVLSRDSEVFEYHVRRAPKNYQEIATAFVICGLLTLIMQWHRGGFRETPQEMAVMTRSLLSQPLVPEL